MRWAWYTCSDSLICFKILDYGGKKEEEEEAICILFAISLLSIVLRSVNIRINTAWLRKSRGEGMSAYIDIV